VTKATLPRPDELLIGKDGVMTASWYRYFSNLQIDVGAEDPSPYPPSTPPDLTILDASDLRGEVAALQGLVSFLARRLEEVDSSIIPPVSHAGNIVGPSSATDNAVARFDGTTGAKVQNSAFIVDDNGHVTSFGGNITFPASQAASGGVNTLDDYEEDSFTPAFEFGGGTTGLTYTTQTGRYTKIGNRVFFTITLVINSNGSSTGSARITGLPFTSSNAANYACAILAEGLAASVLSVQAQVVGNGTAIALYSFTAGTTTALNDTTVPDGSVFVVSGHYHV
jgi:hypothetical protein